MAVGFFLLVLANNGENALTFIDKAREGVSFCAEIVITIAGVAGIIALLFRNKFKTFQAIKSMANMANAFMTKILPDILQGLEKKQFAKEGTLAEWTKIVGSEMCIIKSPQQLNERGEQLLNNSGIKKAIDQNLKMLLEKLERKKPQNLLDVEKYALYILRDEEDESVTNTLKNYLYNNPNETFNTVLFVGSVYFRNLYLQKHPEMLKSSI
jgi:hypothetical protein